MASNKPILQEQSIGSSILGNTQFKPLPEIKSQVYTISHQKKCPHDIYTKVFNEPFRCPLWIYSILITFGIAGFIFWIASIDEFDKDGNQITTQQRWISATISIFSGLLLAMGFSWWMFKECEKCQYGQSWLIMIVAIIVPIIIVFIVLAIFAALTGIAIWSIF